MPTDRAQDRPRRLIAVIVVAAVLAVAAAGWSLHWNAYVNLMLTLGGLGCLATWCAALAAAAPGETTPKSDTVECPRCGNETTEADMTYSGCGLCRAEAAAADLVGAAPGETEQTP